MVIGTQLVRLIELSRRGWYDTGTMRRLLADIMEDYQMELIENRLVPGRKPAARSLQQRLIE